MKKKNRFCFILPIVHLFTAILKSVDRCVRPKLESEKEPLPTHDYRWSSESQCLTRLIRAGIYFLEAEIGIDSDLLVGKS